MFQFPGFAFVSYFIQKQIPSLDICKSDPRPETGRSSELQISKVGFPIRKFTDQSLFAAPHDLSQRTTSFIASQRQGIHQIPLRHLIALIIDAHRSAADLDHSGLRMGPKFGIDIKDQFASNTPEDVAVMRRPLTEALAEHTRCAVAIGCISSSRCHKSRLRARGPEANSTPFKG
jgi:hypothetical protein